MKITEEFRLRQHDAGQYSPAAVPVSAHCPAGRPLPASVLHQPDKPRPYPVTVFTDKHREKLFTTDTQLNDIQQRRAHVSQG